VVRNKYAGIYYETFLGFDLFTQGFPLANTGQPFRPWPFFLFPNPTFDIPLSKSTFLMKPLISELLNVSKS
jgi:hypothetical protein